MTGIRVLNVAEKPSVAREASKVLSRNSARFKRSGQGNTGAWEFQYVVKGTQCTMVFTSVAGHLMSTDFQEPFNKWRSCAPVELFSKPICRYVPKSKKNLETNLRSEARKAQWLILWLDCDREGEHICFEVMEVCQKANSRLQVMRAQFSTLLERDLQRALHTLREPNRFEAEAVDARQEIDLRSGASFTRFLTLSLQSKFDWSSNLGPTDEKPVISYGPCQFPTLGFIVKRQWEIYAHIPEEFWFIHVVYRNDSMRSICEFTWERKRIFDRYAAEMLFEPCSVAPVTARVENVQEKPIFRYPPHPLSTIEFAKKASSYLRIGSQEAMKIAEDLYQAGFISYPRTETDIFSQEFDLRSIVAEQTSHPAWGSYASNLLNPGTGLWRNPPGGGHDDKAHPPIHPTKFSTGESNWDAKKKKVYEFVVRHFLACCSERAVGSESVIRIDVEGEKFSTRGVSVKARNWLDVYTYSNWNQASLPALAVGDVFTPHEVSLKSGQTRPPEKLKETDLIAKMEQHGIGTDATMAQHIDTTLKRGYAIRDEQTMQFSPTPLGEALVYAYKEMGLDVLWQPFLRADTELQVSNIACGQVTKGSVIEDAIAKTKTQFLKALPQLTVLERSIGHFFTRIDGGGNSTDPHQSSRQPTEGSVIRLSCPLCAQNVLLRSGNGGYRLQCSQSPASCNHRMVFPRATVQATVLPERCTRCAEEAGVFLVDLKFRRSAIPPGFRTELRGQCIYCSRSIKELFEACGVNHNVGSSSRTTNFSAPQPQRRPARNDIPSVPTGGSRPPPRSSMPLGEPSNRYNMREPERRQVFEGSRNMQRNYARQLESETTFVSATGHTFPPQHQAFPSNQGNDRCFNCGGVGHWSSNCPNPSKRRR